MTITVALRNHLGLADGVSDEEVRKAALEALSSGDLSVDKLAELSKPIDEGKEFEDKLASTISTMVADAVAANIPAAPVKTADEPTDETSALDAPDKMDLVLESLNKLGEALTAKAVESTEAGSDEADKAVAIGAVASAPKARVKAVCELFSTTKSAMHYPDKKPQGSARTMHPMAGLPVNYLGRNLDNPSQLDNAVNGAWFRYQVAKQWPLNDPERPGIARVRDIDRELLKYAANEMTWTGVPRARADSDESDHDLIDHRRLTDMEIKTIIDDSTSGGQEAVPDTFDAAVISTPLIFGELFPLVNLIELQQGSNVDGFTINNPTINSNAQSQSEGVSFPTAVESSASFIGNLATLISVADGAIEVGSDFESDSPANIGSVIAQLFGNAFMQWLDEQIAGGDGTTEPLGVLTTTGIGQITTSAGTAGPATVGDIEELIFCLDKAHRGTDGRTVFFGSERTYRHIRSVGITSSDQTRVFGMDHLAYHVMDIPYKIESVGTANGTVGYVNLAHYRMYRRQGLQIRVETSGRALALSNNKLIVVRARFGGQMELATYCCFANDFPIQSGQV